MVRKTEARPKPKPKPKEKEKGKLARVGALWIANGKNGKFMSGKITIGEEPNEEVITLLVFKNGYKELSKHPDYIIYIPPDEMEDDDKATDDDIPF